MVEEGHNGSLQLSGGGALDVANKPLVGGQRRTERATINSANISSRTNYTVQNLVSPFPANGRLTDPRWRVRTERGGRSPSCARRPRAQLLSRDTIGHASFFDDLHEAEWSEGQLLEHCLDK